MACVNRPDVYFEKPSATTQVSEKELNEHTWHLIEMRHDCNTQQNLSIVYVVELLFFRPFIKII